MVPVQHKENGEEKYGTSKIGDKKFGTIFGGRENPVTKSSPPFWDNPKSMPPGLVSRKNVAHFTLL